MEILNLKKEDYYTQRNNPGVYGDNPDVEGEEDYYLKASWQCMPTGYAMFLRGNKKAYKNPSNLPDDAYFAKLLVAKEAWEFAKEKYPWLIDAGYAPNQIHGMYGSYLSPIVCGRRVSDFRTDLTFEDYISRIMDLQVIMTSGSFPGIDGHAFDMIGLRSSEGRFTLSSADPYGNPHTGYKDVRGYDIPFTKEYFIEHVKPNDKMQEKKWGHVII